MNTLFLIAGGLSALVCLIHVILGGRGAARPLLNAKSLHTMPRMTNYYCWHLVTIALALMAVGYFLSARVGAATDGAILATAFAVLAALLCFGINVRWSLKHIQHPQWVLFAPIAGLGLAGIYA